MTKIIESVRLVDSYVDAEVDISDIDIEDLIEEVEENGFLVIEENASQNTESFKKMLCDRYSVNYHTAPEVLIEHIKKELI